MIQDKPIIDVDHQNNLQLTEELGWFESQEDHQHHSGHFYSDIFSNLDTSLFIENIVTPTAKGDQDFIAYKSHFLTCFGQWAESGLSVIMSILDNQKTFIFALNDIKIMKDKPKATEIIIKGNKLECSVCRNDTFWERQTLMNTPGLTFLGLEWANKKAQNYICDHCGYVHWFLDK